MTTMTMVRPHFTKRRGNPAQVTLNAQSDWSTHGLQLVEAHIAELGEAQVAQAEHDEVVALAGALGHPTVAGAAGVEEVNLHEGVLTQILLRIEG